MQVFEPPRLAPYLERSLQGKHNSTWVCVADGWWADRVDIWRGHGNADRAWLVMHGKLVHARATALRSGFTILMELLQILGLTVC